MAWKSTMRPSIDKSLLLNPRVFQVSSRKIVKRNMGSMATATPASVFPAPYHEGVKLSIRKHVPPTPFGHGPCPRRRVGIGRKGRDADRIALALAKPPMRTQTPTREEHTFTITGSKTLRRFNIDPGGAHVVTGYLDGDEEDFRLAKIYDGVYYPLEDPDSGWDCMTMADAEYATEAWAYETMQPVEGVGSKLVPGYHGAWTFPVATDRPGRRRWVRMILLELVHGETVLAKMRKATKNDVIDFSLLPDRKTRLRVLKETLEAETSIWWYAEVLHGDLSPRNVMVRPDGSVVIIDFGQALIYRFGAYLPHPKHDKDAHPLPDSPIERYWPFAPGAGTFADPGNPWESWVPKSWLRNQELAALWLLRTWGRPEQGKYAPLSDYFLNHPAHAERSPKLQAALEKLGRKPAKK